MELSTNFALYLPEFIQGVFYILLFFFSLYGIFLAYHWFSFGTSKSMSTVALATYLLGGAVLFMILAASIRLL